MRGTNILAYCQCCFTASIHPLFCHSKEWSCKIADLFFFFTFMWLCIVTNFFLIKPTDALISQINFCQETLHISVSSSAHHQEFSMTLSCLKAVINPVWQIPVPNVKWKTPEDGQRNCLKHVEFLDKNKFGKLVHLLALLKRKVLIIHLCHSPFHEYKPTFHCNLASES